MNDLYRQGDTLTINDWVVRLRKPQSPGLKPVMLLLHGWTGDENSMWVFTPRLPEDMLLIAPRGPYQAWHSGYSWHPLISRPLPELEDFLPAVEALFKLLSPTIFPQADFSQLHLAGFSQGAALAYAITLTNPERVISLAGLSGFVPDGAEHYTNNPALRGLPVFMAHGSLDELVPVSKARDGAALFQRTGAQVIYCEDEVGHKLSANCFRGLEAFYQQQGCD